MIKKCVQCGKKFKLTESEIHFYESKGLEIPKRCEACRKQNKKKKSGKTAGKSPFLVALAVIIAIIGYVVNGPDAFINHDNTSYNNELSYNETHTNSNVDHSTSVIEETQGVTYKFRKEQNLIDHFEKHKDEFDYTTAEEYLEGANRVINTQGVLHKIEAEDGDDVYYLEATNELVIVSTDGYIRTYFKPSDGIAYFNRT